MRPFIRRGPVWEFANRIQIIKSVLMALCSGLDYRSRLLLTVRHTFHLTFLRFDASGGERLMPSQPELYKLPLFS
jgi:hypothetical protein